LNVLKPNLRISIQTLLQVGTPQREIARVTGVDRKTIRRYAREANSPRVATGFPAGKLADGDQNPPPRPPAPKPTATTSACEIHRDWIEGQLVLGRNAMSIYQDLVELFGFTHRYNSVKRFVNALKAREPDRFDVLEALPGEEAQVDFGLGALTRLSNGKYRRPFFHIAKALALLAVQRGYTVFYREAHALIEDINQARELNELRKYRATLKAADLVVIDDLFLRKLPSNAGDELADVIMSRYEKSSTLITSNREIEDWGKILSGDVVIVTPLLDRLMHHGHLLKFVGKSWRLKESAERLAKARQTA
jgi:IstB-like ATP binding protein